MWIGNKKHKSKKGLKTSANVREKIKQLSSEIWLE